MNILEVFSKKSMQKNPARLILLMYIIVIFIGTIILCMPISSAVGKWTNPLDALFTAVSATCVTGLVTLTTATHWSIVGKIVIIIMIQLGGLGVMTAASIVSLIFNKKMSIVDRIFLSEEKGSLSISGIIKLIKFIIYSTFIIELLGAIFFMFTFIPEFGVIKGIWFSIFHSISAFCNAGFDILGESSLAPYVLNFNITIVASLLIIIGGIGHKVIGELITKKFNFKSYSLHSKLVIFLTIFLLIFPTIFFLIIEWNNPNTIGNYNFLQKSLVAFFQSVTLRTAGFFTSYQELYRNASTILMFILMFIGGSPAGTAGGFKTTTFLGLFLVTKANIRQEKDITIMKRRMPSELSKKVISLFTISVMWIFLSILVLSITDSSKSIIDIVYEVFSAYGTVGLTRGLTSQLSSIGKIVIMMTMIFGKIGPLSLFVAFIKKKEPTSYRLREEEILIG